MKLIVSLHDVSPQTWQPCREILAGLRALGLRRVPLLVIPDHHGRGHFLKDSAFCEWLREQVAAGCEAVIHGYTHSRPARGGESLATRLVTRSYTAGEGEFFDLPREVARERVERALGEFREAGLEPSGFIAPAWLLGAEAEAGVREAGLHYTTRLRTVLNLRSGASHHSRSLCWSVRAAWRRLVSLAWNAALFHRLENAPLLRVALHPVDLAHPQVWRQILAITAAALRVREACNYGEWVANTELSPPCG